MADATTTTRPYRLCDSCGGVDDHPRHVHGLGPDGPNPTAVKAALAAVGNAGDNLEDILVQIQDVSTQVKHQDCCRTDGCPDGSCYEIGALGGEGKIGEELLAVLESGQIDHVGDELNAARNSAEKDEDQ